MFFLSVEEVEDLRHEEEDVGVVDEFGNMIAVVDVEVASGNAFHEKVEESLSDSLDSSWEVEDEVVSIDVGFN